MTGAVSLQQLIEDLIEALRGGQPIQQAVQTVADENNCSVEDVYEAYNGVARQYASQGVQTIPHNAPPEVANQIIQQNITQITNIDNSRTANVFGDNNDVELGDNIATGGGVVIDESTVDGDVVTGDRNVTGDDNQANTGDFGDNAKIGQQDRGDVTQTSTGGEGGTATGGAGGAATGGDATGGTGAGGFGGDGGAGGAGGLGGLEGDGGAGGAGGAGGDADGLGGDATGGAADAGGGDADASGGDGGDQDAGDQNIDFGP
jgi:hypothetical protein